MFYFSQINTYKDATGRNGLIDCAKGLAIILMVAGHACTEGGAFTHWLHDFIYTFHMPFFFIISGYLYKAEKGNRPLGYVKSKFNSLYVKFIFYNVAFILLNNLLWKIGIINADYTFYGSSWHQYSVGEIGDRILRTLVTFGLPEWTALALWFLKDLFLVAIIFMFALKIIYVKEHFEWFVIACLIVGCLLGINVKRVACELFLYGFGYMLKYKTVKLNTLVVLILVAVSLISPFVFDFMELQYVNGLFTTLRFLILGIVGFLWFMWICEQVYSKKNVCINRALRTVNQNAIPIMAMHVVFFKIGTFTLSGGGISAYNIVSYNDTNWLWLPYTIIGVVGPMMITFVCNRIRRYLNIKNKWKVKQQVD